MIEVGHWDAASQGPLTEAALRRWLESQGYAVHRYDYAPGTRFASHHHDVDKIDAVLSGCFRIEMGGAHVDLGPGMWVHVRRGAPHSAAVVGKQMVVSLDAVRLADLAPV